MDAKSKEAKHVDNQAANRDPITGEAGSHPVGTGVGSVGGAAAGAEVGGVVGGPVGAAVGGVIGAVAGGATGHVAGEAIDPTVELVYWREVYTKRPYYRPGQTFADYEAAYRLGIESALKANYRGRDWKSIERELAHEWATTAPASRRPWHDIRDAAHDAWSRANRSDV